MLKKPYFNLLLLLYCFSAVQAQDNTADSLRQRIALARSDSMKWVEMVNLSQYYGQNNTDSAIQIALRTLEFAKKSDPRFISRSLNNVGLQYMNQGEFDKASSYYYQALEAGKKENCRLCQATTLGNVGVIFWKKKDYDKGESYFLQSLAELRILKDTLSIIRTLNNLGVIYLEIEKINKAEVVFKEALGILEYMKSGFGLETILSNLGNISYHKDNYKDALAYYQRDIEVSKKTGNNHGLYLGTINSGWAYLRMKDYGKAIDYFNQAKQVSTELKNEEYLAQVYGSLSDAYKEMGDYKNAFLSAEKYIDLKDSINTRLSSKTFAEMDAKYRTQQKEAELIKKQIQIEHQASLKNIILASAIALVLFLVMFFQYFRSRQLLKRREAELTAQLEHAESEKLRDLNQVKSTFFANISHEFRTPLTLIISPLEQMINGSFQGDYQKYYRIMFRNGKRLLNLVNQLLDLSKLETGKLKLKASEGDLGKFVSGIVWSFESLAFQKQTELQVNMPEKPFTCYFDADKIEKIVTNIVSNAFKFSTEGSKIKVLLQEAGDKALMEFTDNGIGIPEEQLPHLFERFYHSTPSEIQPGTGVGLALTKELVELHGGEISVESREGSGTVITVTVAVSRSFFKEEEIAPGSGIHPPEAPLDLPDVIRTDSRKNNHAQIDLKMLSKNEKQVLLIVEDNPEVRQYIREHLESTYLIIEAENGLKGLEKAVEQTPDLIITDVMMPEMDGISLCKELKNNEKTSHIPVIMLTARSEQSEKLEGLETGAEDYIVKPFDFRELMVRIANLLSQRQKLQTHYRRTLAFATTDPGVENVDSAFLLKVKEIIESNLEEEHFNVVDLGHLVGMSRSQLHRKLTSLTGFAPNEIIRNMRLERAKLLLEKNAGNISEVAYMCGFSSPAYFAKCFKDYFDYSPSETKK